MVTKHKNISMIRGDTLSFGVQFPGLDGQDLDELYFSCSSNYMSSDYVFIKSLSDGIAKSEDPENPDTYIIRVVPDDTESAIPGMYYYDIEAHVNGDTFTVMSGNLEIVADVTYKPENFFTQEQYVPDIDPNEFLEALDVVGNSFNISIEEYLQVANKLAVIWKTGIKCFKGEFVRYIDSLYRAKIEIAYSSTTPPTDTNSWELIGTSISTSPTGVEGVDYNIKDLFSNMIDYCNRSVDQTLTNNANTLKNVNTVVKNEATRRYQDDANINGVIANHIRVVRKKHSLQVKSIAANSYKTVTVNISAEGATATSKLSTKKMNGYAVLGVAGFRALNKDAVPIHVYSASAKTNGVGELTVCIRNISSAALTVDVDVWILWYKKDDKATLTK